MLRRFDSVSTERSPAAATSLQALRRLAVHGRYSSVATECRCGGPGPAIEAIGHVGQRSASDRNLSRRHRTQVRDVALQHSGAP